MKVVLNGLATFYPVSGVGRYVIELSRNLESLLGEGRIFWFGRTLSKDQFDLFEPNPLNHHMQYVLRKIFRQIPWWRMPTYLWRNHQFKKYVEKIKPSLYHETNYIPLDFEGGPTLITVYDLSLIRHPEWHPKDRVKYFEKYFLKKIGQAELIITISEFSKKEIITLLGLRPNKIYVTYLGVNGTFSPEGERMEGLPFEYILFVGNLEPRKNLITLFQVYRSLPRSLKERFPLVIAGAVGWNTRELEKALLMFPEDEKPILIGYVPQHLLPQLYRGASLFVYPSLYEGFGLPVLEAMASGIPVLASNTTSLPELVEHAGILVNPNDIDGLKEALVELLSDEKKRKALSLIGIERAKQFSWEKCARETIEVYQKVLLTK